MRKKIKKVIKGLEKASKTHAKQATILKSGLKVFKARGGRDMGAGSSGMGSGNTGGNMGGSGAVDTGDLGSEAANVAANVSATSHGGGGGNNNTPSSSPSPSGVTVRKGPLQVPTIGLTSLVINQISKDLYNQRNLKEQKKVDALGGEMLTQGKRGPTTDRGGDNGGGSKTPLIKPTLKASVPKVPLPLQKVKPKSFEFNFNEGGLVRGAGKILKNRKRKVRIF
tara:strand:+ start:1674 stop:2345 length:672 start_codon:yes stop_codon:yes gene_type:complete